MYLRAKVDDVTRATHKCVDSTRMVWGQKLQHRHLVDHLRVDTSVLAGLSKQLWDGVEPLVNFGCTFRNVVGGVTLMQSVACQHKSRHKQSGTYGTMSR